MATVHTGIGSADIDDAAVRRLVAIGALRAVVELDGEVFPVE